MHLATYRTLLVIGVLFCFLILEMQKLQSANLPRIGTDGASSQLCVWRVFNSDINRYEMKGAFHSNELKWANFSHPITLESHAENPILAVNKKGTAIVVWSGEDIETGNCVLRASMYNSSEWTSPVTISNSYENAADNFKVNIDETGTSCIVWTSQSAEGKRTLYSAIVDVRGKVSCNLLSF